MLILFYHPNSPLSKTGSWSAYDESMAVADNPVVVETSGEQIQIMHGGLFYATGLAAVADTYTEILSRIAELLDRQILLLMDPAFNGGLLANLHVEGDGHVKGIHQLCSALLQRARGLSSPSRAFSFSCEGNNQDIVPCAMTALSQASDLTEIVSDIVRAAYFTGERGVCLRLQKTLPSDLKLSNWSKISLSHLREFPIYILNQGLKNQTYQHRRTE